MKIKTTTLIAIVCLNIPAIAEEVLNDDFETIVGAPIAMVKQMEDGQWTFQKPVRIPRNWVVNAFIKGGEYRLIEDRLLCHSAPNSVYIKGDLKCNRTFKVAKGDTIELKFWTKDPEAMKIAGCVYLYNSKFVFLGEIDVEQRAEVEWNEHTMDFTIPEIAKNGEPITEVMIALRSGSGAYFDDVKMTLTTNSK